MIILRVKKDGRPCATLECERGSFVFVGEKDPTFETFLEDRLAHGIPVYRDVRDGSGAGLGIQKDIVEKKDVEPHMVRDFLIREGYSVDEIHPEVEKEIRMLIEEVPDENPDKAKLMEKLPAMNHLEQTAILEALRNAEKEEGE